MSIQTLNTNASLYAQQASLGTTLSNARFTQGGPGNFMQSSSQLFGSLSPMLSQFSQFSPLGQNPAFQGFQALTSALGQFTQTMGQILQMAGQGAGQLYNQFNSGFMPQGPGPALNNALGMVNQFLGGNQGLGMGGMGGMGGLVPQGGFQMQPFMPGGQGGFQTMPFLPNGQNGFNPMMNPNMALPQNLPNGSQDKSEVMRNVSRYFDNLAGPNGLINKDTLEKALSHPHEEVRQTAQALLNDPELMKQMDTAHARLRGNIGEKADGTISRGDAQAELGKTNFARGDMQTLSTLTKNFEQLTNGKGVLDRNKIEALAVEPKNGNPQHDALVTAALDLMAKPELWSKLDNAALEAKGKTRHKNMGDGKIVKEDLQAALRAAISNTPLAGKTPGGAGAAFESLGSKILGETGIQQAANKIPFVQR